MGRLGAVHLEEGAFVCERSSRQAGNRSSRLSGARRSGTFHLLAYLSLVMFCALELSGATTQKTPTTTPVPDDVRYVLAQMEKSRQSFSDLSYDFKEVNFIAPSTQPVGMSEGSVKRSGRLEQCDKQVRTTTPEGVPAAPVRWTGFIGRSSAGRFGHAPRAIASEYEHADPSEMSDAARQAMRPYTQSGQDYFAFGSGTQLLQELLREVLAAPDAGYFRLNKSDGPGEQNILRLELFLRSLKMPEVPSYVFHIDPTKGFAVVHSENRNNIPPYVLLNVADITLTDVSGRGSWYPTKIITQYYGGEPNVQRRDELFVSNVQVAPKFGPDDFTIATLDLPEDVRLLRIGADGLRRVLVHQNDRFVLAEKQPPVPTTAMAAANANESSDVAGGGSRQKGYFIAAAIAFVVGLGFYCFARIAENRRRSKR